MPVIEKKSLFPYLSFHGNCLEAMKFYQDCLGGELHVQTVADTPAGDSLPAIVGKKVLQAFLSNDDWALYGTDLMDDELLNGNSVTLFLCCRSAGELRKLSARLSFGGKTLAPVTRTLEGGYNCMLADKYGNRWFLQYSNRDL